jgi:GlcNAc-P-P-Und epimerase
MDSRNLEQTKPAIAPFNEYGRSKYQAEEVFRRWQQEDANQRTLVIVRPTVVFGERNRGNVYNLLKQLASGHFVMVGKGPKYKSMAYVENVAAFLEHALSFGPWHRHLQLCRQTRFDMNTLIRTCGLKWVSRGGIGFASRTQPAWR